MNGSIAVIPLLLLAIPLASAQAQLPEPGTLPDSPFYGLKRFFESIGTTFTFDQEAKVTRALELAELRLAEAAMMAEMDKPEFVQSLTSDYEKEIENSNSAVSSISDPEKKRIASERVALATSHHLEVLDSVQDRVPEQARSAIAAAKDTSIEGNIESLRILATEDPDRAAELAMQAAQGRAEKARDAAGSGNEEVAIEATEHYREYERFGQEISSIAQQVGDDPERVQELVAKARSLHITILEEVKDRVPTNARDAIDEAIKSSQLYNETGVASAGQVADDTQIEIRGETRGDMVEGESGDQVNDESEENEREPPSNTPAKRP